eukprot:comp20423_c1_seq4/m.25913 comp20423_c1_seq4/g.25913  ORF comp20423_c1_seq4/g.25913 comp20423_c1_seq4/m.25913 type:complete len:222 (-) comp20423_c1_seq4:77-742(-)
MAFANIATDASPLDAYLADRSYIEGYTPSQADAVVFAALGKAPEARFVNALRWYNHIASYGSEVSSFPGEKKDLSAYGAAVKAAPAAAPAAAEEEDDVDLFGSDEEEDEEKEKIKAQRLAEYAAKKSVKPGVIAKSQIIIDVKPWDDETPMDKLEECVRSVECEGLLWGTSKLVEIGYGIKKLQITCVVEDDKCGTDYLEEHITAFEDYVQSMDVVAFNKL